MAAKPATVPTYRPPLNATSSTSTQPSKTSSTTSSPSSTIPLTREANAGALKMEWPRIPLPGWPDGEADDAAETIAASAARGRELARLLDPEAPVPGVTQGTLRPEIAALAVPRHHRQPQHDRRRFCPHRGWGHYGTGDAVMPGQGRIVRTRIHPGRTRRARRRYTRARRKDAGRVSE